MWWCIKPKMFDPEICFDVRTAATKEELLEKIGDLGLVNSYRVGEGRRTSQSSEAYCVRRWILHLADNDQLTYPVSVYHQDSPDFIVVENGFSYGLEVTEASTKEDGREMARLEKLEPESPDSELKPTLLGGFGGRGADGFIGDEPLQFVFQDIQDAIDRKSGKYAQGATIDLLIYPNSNPAFVFSMERDLPRLLRMSFNRREFRRIFLIWGDETLNQINFG